MTIKVIVAGSRKWPWPNYLKQVLTHYLSNYSTEDIVILCGEALGPDLLGRRWAEERGITVESYPADWDTYKKAAGYIRNKQMAENATHLIAFWDGTSRGTRHMIKLAHDHGLKVKVFNQQTIRR